MNHQNSNGELPASLSKFLVPHKGNCQQNSNGDLVASFLSKFSVPHKGNCQQNSNGEVVASFLSKFSESHKGNCQQPQSGMVLQYEERKRAEIMKISPSGHTQGKWVTDEAYKKEVKFLQFRNQPSLVPPQIEKNYFGHPHLLQNHDLKETDRIYCRVCKLKFGNSSAYGCKTCGFFIHKSCFEIPIKIQHPSHQAHPLTLLPCSPYKSGVSICNACRCGTTSFVYNCSRCEFDLNVKCAALSSTSYRKDHKYPLLVCYNFPVKKDGPVNCNVCRSVIAKNGWVYYNRDSNFITHVTCAREEEISVVQIREKLGKLRTP